MGRKKKSRPGSHVFPYVLTWLGGHQLNKTVASMYPLIEAIAHGANSVHKNN